jgi:hypothetical protein
MLGAEMGDVEMDFSLTCLVVAAGGTFGMSLDIEVFRCAVRRSYFAIGKKRWATKRASMVARIAPRMT